MIDFYLWSQLGIDGDVVQANIQLHIVKSREHMCSNIYVYCLHVIRGRDFLFQWGGSVDIFKKNLFLHYTSQNWLSNFHTSFHFSVISDWSGSEAVIFTVNLSKFLIQFTGNLLFKWSSSTSQSASEEDAWSSLGRGKKKVSGCMRTSQSDRQGHRARRGNLSSWLFCVITFSL